MTGRDPGPSKGPLRVAFLSPWRHDEPASWSGMIERQFQSLSALDGVELLPWYTGDVRPSAPDRALERALGPGRGGIYRAPLGYLTARRRAARVDRWVDVGGPDVVLAVAASTDAALMSPSVPVVHVTDATFDLVQDFYPDTTGLHPFTRAQARAVERRLNRRVDAHAVSTRWAARGLTAAGVSAERVHVIPFGPRLAPESPVHRAPEDHRRVLLIASDWQRKAGDVVIRAVERARSLSARPPELTVVGAAPGRLPSWVRAVGRVAPQRMAELYASHDIVADLATANAGGVTLTDAHAFGLPMIATDVGGVSDIVDHGVTGFLVSPTRAVSEAAEALLRLEDDRTWWHMADAALDRAARVLHWDTWAATTYRVLRDVYREAAGPREER